MASKTAVSLLPTRHLKNILTPEKVEDLLKMKQSLPVTAKKPYNTESQVDKVWSRDFVLSTIPDFDRKIEICYSHFLTQTLPYIVHTDGPLSAEMRGHYNILIPLETNGDAGHTVTFEQGFRGPGRAFVKGQTEDELEVYDFTKDYSGVSNLTESEFPENVRAEFLDHIEPASLEGLSLEKVIEWVPGDIILFDRYRLHSSSSFKKFGLKNKTSFVVATRFSLQ